MFTARRQNHELSGFQRPLYLVAISAVLSCLAACGGSGNDPVASGGGPPPGYAPGYAYIASADVQRQQVPGAIYQYSIGADGSLAPLSVAAVPSGVTPTAVVADPNGHYVYAANLGDATVSQYAVGAAGGLMPLSPAVVGIPGAVPQAAGYSMSVDPKGRFLYVVIMPLNPPYTSASIAQYSISTDGTLAPLATPYINVPASASGALAIDSGAQHAYLPAATSVPGGEVFQFSIGADGTLSPLAPATAAATQGAIGVVIASSGQTAYVLSRCADSACDGEVAQYTIGADGALGPTGTITLTGGHVNPVTMVQDDSGSSAYLLVNFMGVDTNTGSVYQYAIDNTGTLVPEEPVSLIVASGAVTESTYGPGFYVLSANAFGQASGSPPGGHVDYYSIGSGGRLTAVRSTPVAGSLPTAMALVVAH
ncbi:MAG: lactonase family protein [Gammaproteobacteria bacterium]|nr:MAG: lactonase family protein [Gammaproteobacteria bacterium]